MFKKSIEELKKSNLKIRASESFKDYVKKNVYEKCMGKS